MQRDPAPDPNAEGADLGLAAVARVGPDADPSLSSARGHAQLGQSSNHPTLQIMDEIAHIFAAPRQINVEIDDPLSRPVISILPAPAGRMDRKTRVQQVARYGTGAGSVEWGMLNKPDAFWGVSSGNGRSASLHVRQSLRIIHQAGRDLPFDVGGQRAEQRHGNLHAHPMAGKQGRPMRTGGERRNCVSLDQRPHESKASMNRIDLGAIWQDAIALGRRNADIIVPVAGMFLLLPSLIAQWFLPTMALPREATLATLSHAINNYVSGHWPYLIGQMAVTGLGSLAILALLLRADRPTVAQSLRIAVIVLPIYLLATLLQSFLLMLGFMAFIVPGLYLLGRTALLAPIAAAEEQINPINLITRSWVATQGNGWRIFTLMAVIFVTGFILQSVVVGVVSMMLRFVAGAEIAGIAGSIFTGVISTVIAVIMLLVAAALYRRLHVLPLVPHTN
jgi:hypothetical protein